MGTLNSADFYSPAFSLAADRFVQGFVVDPRFPLPGLPFSSSVYVYPSSPKPESRTTQSRRIRIDVNRVALRVMVKIEEGKPGIISGGFAEPQKFNSTPDCVNELPRLATAMNAQCTAHQFRTEGEYRSLPPLGFPTANNRL